MRDYIGDDSTMGPPTKKRVALRQISKDDGSDAEDESLLKEVGTFEKASEEVLASRRIIKVRRTTTPASSVPNPFAGIRLTALSASSVDEVPSAASPPNPAPAVSFPAKAIEEENSSDFPAPVSPPVKETAGNYADFKGSGAVESSAAVEASFGEGPGTPTNGTPTGGEDSGENEKHEEVKQGAENGDEVEVESKAKGTEEQLEKAGEEDGADEGEVSEQKQAEGSGTNSTNAFGQLSSSKNAFAGSFGTGFSSSTFSFGNITPSFGASSGFASFGSGSAFALKAASEGVFSPSFGKANGGSSFQLFGSQANSITPVTSSAQHSAGSASLQEVPLETGEEQEKVVFAADATLFEFLEGGWKERGKGELKVNVSEQNGGRSRLLMRSRGNYRLLLNASLFPDIKMTSMDSRGVTFACVNSATEGKMGLTTYAVKLKDSAGAAAFREAVDTHKGKPSVDLKTPENSPTARHDSGRDV